MGPANERRIDPDSAELLPRVYEELRRLARAAMSRERGDHTLQPTALAHEAYARLATDPSSPLADKSRFRVVAASAMRRVLIEHARARTAKKRRGDRKEMLSVEPVAPEPDEYLLALDEALERLAERDPVLARLVELRFFGGLTVEETASALGVSPRTVKRSWSVAKGWLHRDVTGGDDGD